MTSMWGILESYVNLAISKFAGYEALIDYRALIMVAHSSFQQRVDIIGSLCERLLPEFPELRDYKNVIARIQLAQRARNKFAHNSITTNAETGEVTISCVTARGKLKTTTEIVKLEAIVETTANIHEAMCALHTLVTGKELKPVWERQT